MPENKYINAFLVSFPLVIAIIAIVWFINKYKSDRLSQKLTAMNIKKLEKELGFQATDDMVKSILNDNLFDKTATII